MNGWDAIDSIWYRGKLDSCNYTCSYCPFGRKNNQQADKQDQLEFEQFCKSITEKNKGPLRIMIIPYGEALIHSYYREGILGLAKLSHVTGIGCQTNLSFSASSFIKEIQQQNISPEKIKLWATFHPEMTTIESFTRKVKLLRKTGIELCTGVVGNPEQLELITRLRSELPPDVYLFVNAMEGLKRKLTNEEKKQLEEIDPLFSYEKGVNFPGWENCKGGKTSVFIDAKGDCYPCPRSRIKGGNFYQGSWEDFTTCGRKRCDCYIAYCHIKNNGLQSYMQENYQWRIPVRQTIKAAFFDIDGTIINQQGIIPVNYHTALHWLAERIPLFLATALPISYAKKRLGNLFSLFQGGIFADGGHILYKGTNEYIPISSPLQINLTDIRINTYKAGEQIYKYTISSPSKQKTQELKTLLEQENNYNIFTKGRLLTLTHPQASKRNGLLHLCQKIQTNPLEVLAIGDTLHDWDMLSATGYPCAVPDAEKELLEKVPYHINPGHLPLFFKGE